MFIRQQVSGRIAEENHIHIVNKDETSKTMQKVINCSNLNNIFLHCLALSRVQVVEYDKRKNELTVKKYIVYFVLSAIGLVIGHLIRLNTV